MITSIIARETRSTKEASFSTPTSLGELLHGHFLLVPRAAGQRSEAGGVLAVDGQSEVKHIVNHLLAPVRSSIMQPRVALSVDLRRVSVAFDEQLRNVHAIGSDSIAQTSDASVVLCINFAIFLARLRLRQVALNRPEVAKLAGLLQGKRCLPLLVHLQLGFSGHATHPPTDLLHKVLVHEMILDLIPPVGLQVFEKIGELGVVLESLDLPREVVGVVLHGLPPDVRDRVHDVFPPHRVGVRLLLQHPLGLVRVALEVVLILGPLVVGQLSIV
mmetsp:Transcript_18020/g.46721  ORF Transcript_18020/g.46721 Transcript_18020/m.46721 type:complete len:273 (+) Transcript_18020:101-919(+)